MTMEVPPFQSAKTNLAALSSWGSKSAEQLSARLRVLVKWAEIQARSTPPKGELCVFSVMLNVGVGNGVPPPVLKHGPRSQTDAQGRRYCCQYFSRTEREVRTHLWCAQNFFAQHRPAPRGLSSSVPVWTRKVVNYA